MTFQLIRSFKLDNIGWVGCEIKFKSVNYPDRKKFAKDVAGKDTETIEKMTIQLLKDHLVGGHGLDEENKKVEITKENFEELPGDVIDYLGNKLLLRGIDENL